MIGLDQYCKNNLILKWNVKNDPKNFKSPCFHVDFSLSCCTINHHARRYAIQRRLETTLTWQVRGYVSRENVFVDNSSPLLSLSCFPFQHFTIYGLLYRYFCVSVLIVESLLILSVLYFFVCLFIFHLLSLPIIVRALAIWFLPLGAM